MCGRYTLRSKPAEIAAALGLAEAPAGLVPRYNIAPTQTVFAAVVDPADGARRLREFMWGLVPPWADDPKIGGQMLNARSETLADKPSFRDAFRKRRCLVAADGFYEWRREGKSKQPFHIRRRDGRVFGMAALYEHWDRGARAIDSCTVVTTTSNELLVHLHERMPVILSSESFAEWLDPKNDDVARLQRLLVPASPTDWELVPVGPTVNSARNETPECLAPAAPAAPKSPPANQTTLF